MKKKLIQNLLKNTHDADLREQIAVAIPQAGQPGVDLARQVLAETVKLSQSIGKLDPADLYFLVCSSRASDLIASLQGSSLSKTSPNAMALAQTVLNEALTSKAGRKKTSSLDRKEQLAAAQTRRRNAVREEGRKRVDVWITPEAAANLAIIQREHGGLSQAEIFERMLDATVKGEVLKPTGVE